MRTAAAAKIAHPTARSMAYARATVTRVAAVGHVEWVHFVQVERLPTQGEIVHATGSWEEPAGGASVTAIPAARPNVSPAAKLSPAPYVSALGPGNGAAS